MDAEPTSRRFADFRSIVAIPQFQPDPVVLSWMDAELSLFEKIARQHGLKPGFVEMVAGGYFEAFRLVDRVPRDDPFWEGTNRRPTKYRLPGFCRSLIRASPGDLEHRKLAVAVGMIHGVFDASDWNALIASDRSSSGWVADAAMVGIHVGGYDTSPDLLTLCRAWDISLPVSIRLQELSEVSDSRGLDGNWLRRAQADVRKLRDAMMGERLSNPISTWNRATTS